MSFERLSPFRAWWPAIVWTGLITVESTSYLSAENTGHVLYATLIRLVGNIDFYQFLIWHHYFRKIGHVIGYGVLSLLLLRGFQASFWWGRTFSLWAAALAWFGTAFVASLDEWHQSFIPSRAGTPWDVALDSAAGLIFLFSAYLWFRHSRPIVHDTVARSG